MNTLLHLEFSFRNSGHSEFIHHINYRYSIQYSEKAFVTSCPKVVTNIINQIHGMFFTSFKILPRNCPKEHTVHAKCHAFCMILTQKKAKCHAITHDVKYCAFLNFTCDFFLYD